MKGIEERVAPARVLLLGEPGLRERSTEVTGFGSSELHLDQRRLHATLDDFRRKNGFGRAIAAPQIGILKRMIAMNLGDGPVLLVNPEVTWSSDQTFTMWDDCMSFPALLVRLRRAESISLRFWDERGDVHEWPRAQRSLAELLQHEIDHLDGVLAIDRSIDRDAIVLREVFDADRKRFSGLA